MGKFMKKSLKKSKYEFISVDELNKMQARGIELQTIIKDELKKKEFKSAKEYSIELANIISELRKYKKYAKKG